MQTTASLGSIFKTKFFKNAISVALFCLSSYALYQFCEKQTKGFSIYKIGARLDYDPSPINNEPLKPILNQKFTYLAQGGQSFVFESEDKNYVLKLFKRHRKKEKFERDFRSYKIAFERLQNETGLVYVHLNKTATVGLKTTIVDPLGIQHCLNLNEIPFVLQKKADLFYDKIEELIAKNELEEAKALISKMLTAVTQRCQKGIFDEDAKIHRNFGVLNNEVVFIDVGRFTLRDNPQADLSRMTERFSLWLNEKSPELKHYLEERIKAEE